VKKTSEQIREGYRQRLILPEEPDENEIIFYTKSGLEVARSYERVVIGDRGPYIEFHGEMLTKDGIYIPKDQEWRIKNALCYYVEWRTKDKCFVKIYNQKRLVKYADYKIGCWYISPFELTSGLYPELVRSKDD
jgi:hypothetical protein